MKYEFLADTIEVGDDDAEEVYAVTLTQTNLDGGPAIAYILLQRSVVGVDDPDLVEPYIELNDPVNGMFATNVASGELLPTFLHLIMKPGALTLASSTNVTQEIDEIVVRYAADAATLRRLKYGLELVISDGFPWRSLA